MYNMLEDGAFVTDDNGSITTITQQTSANVTTSSTLGNTYTALLPTATPSPSPNEYFCSGRGNQPTFHQSNGNVVAHEKLVVARQRPAHTCCKSSGCVQPTLHSGSFSTASSTSTCLCTLHPSVEHSCPIPTAEISVRAVVSVEMGAALSVVPVVVDVVPIHLEMQEEGQVQFCHRWSSPTSVWSIPINSGPCSGPT